MTDQSRRSKFCGAALLARSPPLSIGTLNVARFEQLVESEGESYLPSIAFTDDAGRTLEFGPNTDDTFWLSYRYSTIRSTFGFCPVDQPRDQQLEACPLETALGLLERHYGSRHIDIVSALPEQRDPDHDTDEGIV
jgi:hypothetical protein